MVNNKSYKRLRKEEKNKKKLKTALKNVATKTQLPKGQNLTDTNFKVKKIVIRDQVKPHDPNDVLYRKKLNISELSARLSHHNSCVKLEALDGLKDLIVNHPIEVLESRYVQILEAVVKLVLDETSSVRKSANKIVALILSAVSTSNLVPFFPSLNSYLLCGMTHIDAGLREDALLLMDTCLKYLPELCKIYAFNLLSVSLDLISDRNKNSRTLSINLDTSQLSTKWRVKVLERIYSLLCCLLKGNEDGEVHRQNSNVHVSFITGTPNNFPVYTPYLNRIDESVSGYTDETLVESTNEKFAAVAYAEAIIPLLLGMYVEVHPVESATVENTTTTVINEEICKLLSLIVGIIQSLWDLIDKKRISLQDKHNPLRSLAGKFTRSLHQTLVSGRFPYSVSCLVKNVGRTKSNSDVNSISNVTINLSVAKLILMFTLPENWDSVLPFLKNCFRLVDQFSQTDFVVFGTCVSKICKELRCSDNSYFLSKTIQICLEGNSPLCSQFFRLLADVALDSTLTHFHKLPEFEKWLESLPEKLTKGGVSPYQLNLISKIAVRNFNAFSSSLDVNIELILDNIPKLGILDEDRKRVMQWQMATLLHWVREWDDELAESLKPALDNCFWGEPLTKYIGEIVRMRMTCDVAQENDVENT